MLALGVERDRHDRRRRPQPGAEQRGNPPGQQSGQMAVAGVLVAVPGDVLELVHDEPRRPMRQIVIGIGETERHEHGRRFQITKGGGQRRRNVLGRVPVRLVEVLMVAELEPVRRGAQLRERGNVLLAAQGDDVVARREAAERVPLRGRVGIRRWTSPEHGHDGAAGVSGQHVAGAHHGVVEVRRHDDDALELVADVVHPLRHAHVCSICRYRLHRSV